MARLKSGFTTDDIADMLDNALRGSEPKREIWDNADYMCAALAMLMADGDRGRDALMTYRAKYDARFG